MKILLKFKLEWLFSKCFTTSACSEVEVTPPVSWVNNTLDLLRCLELTQKQKARKQEARKYEFITTKCLAHLNLAMSCFIPPLF